MDSVTHGSISVLIGLIFNQFYFVPLPLLILVIFVFGVLIDYDHVYHYKKRFPEAQIWNIPQLIKLYFRTLEDDKDRHCYHTFMHEPFGILLVSVFSYLIFVLTGFYPELMILAISCFLAHFVIDLLSGKMKPLAPFNNKFTIELKVLPVNSFSAATISLISFLGALIFQIYVGF